MFSHRAFTDESCYNSNQYRALSLVTVENDLYIDLKERILKIYEESNVSVLEWKKIESAKDRLCAIKLIDLLFEPLLSRKIRIDVIIWDISDTRHAIPGRDDIENLKRMFYHLLSNTLKHRWPDGTKWKITPDENTAIDWGKVKEILVTQESGLHKPKQLDLESFLNLREFPVIIRDYFHIHELEEGKSHEDPFLQIADLFAGMGTYSRNNYDILFEWLQSEGNDTPLLFDTKFERTYSNRDIERFKVIQHLNKKYKRKFAVSLDSFKGLRTLDPDNSLNFWWYEPQSEYDQAPLRLSRPKKG